MKTPEVLVSWSPLILLQLWKIFTGSELRLSKGATTRQLIRALCNICDIAVGRRRQGGGEKRGSREEKEDKEEVEQEEKRGAKAKTEEEMKEENKVKEEGGDNGEEGEKE